MKPVRSARHAWSVARTVGLVGMLAAPFALQATSTAEQSDLLELPERLSQTGLFMTGAPAIDPRNRSYAPQYPLWTDGARKSRWVRLPSGGRIDARRADAWGFPVGTRFWKEFAFRGRRIETRMLWRSTPNTWTFAAYVWNDAQTDAVLAPADGVRDVVEIAPGKRHTVPSRDDCRTCHDTGATPVLGFTALQLSDDRDPAAPHGEALAPGMLTLRRLIDDHLLDPMDPRLAIERPHIPGDPDTRAALGYLTANCGYCHNERSDLATVQFPLSMPAFASPAELARTLSTLAPRSTKWDAPGSAPGTTPLVKPGSPELSALVARMRSRRPSSQMPPLGSSIVDTAGVELVSSWIAGRRF
ncbi:MAG: hypothetical protein AB7Q29_16580 [Vicinamibacterales bacterium]